MTLGISRRDVLRSLAMGVAGEMAAPKASGPGTFRSLLLDAVAALNEEGIEQRQKVSIA